MWIHVLWFLGLAFAAFAAYRSGEAVGASRSDDEIDTLEERNETLRREYRERFYEERKAYLALNDRYHELVGHIAAFAKLFTAPTMIVRGDGKGIPPEGPGRVEFLDDPMSVTQADREAVARQRKAMEREELAALERERAALAGETEDSFEGMEPVLIHDGEATPPPRLDVEGDGTG